jgi:LCP family protein required for cell wall assembly
MTDELEPVDDATKYRRKIDQSLARFSAAHDELEAEEAKRRQRRERLASRLEQTRTKLQRVVPGNADRRDPGRRGSRTSQAGAAAAATLAAGAAAGGSANATQAGGHPAPRPAHGSRAGERGKPDTDEQSHSKQAESKATGSKTEQKAPQTRLQEKKERRNHRSVRTGRIAAAVVAVLVFLSTGAAWGAKTWFNNKFNEIAALDQNSQDITNAAGQTGDENFLVVGSDTRAGAEAEAGVGNADAIPGARTDTIMVAHLPADRKRAVVVSFPRDLEISRPDCERWNAATGEYADEVVEGDSIAKLNTAYAVGGPRCVTKVIQQLTGMRMNHFVGVDFNGFKDMVDAVGGVQVTVDEPVDDSVLGMIIPEPGTVKISGDQALNFVRARHVEGDPTSDYGRIKRQQQFLQSLLSKTLSRDVILDPGRLTGFINAFTAATFGENIGVDQMLTLAQSMKGLDAGSVVFKTVPTTGEANDRGNEVLLESDADELFETLIENRPLPGEEPAGSSTSPTAPSRRAMPS